MDRYDPNDWTNAFVRSNRDFCFDFLKDTAERVLELLEEESYKAAIAGMDRILNGAMTMHNSGAANMRPFLATMSFSEGILIACGMEGAPPDRRRSAALASFEDAKSFTNSSLSQYADQAIRLLKKGYDFDEVQEALCPDFPEDLISLMSDTADRIESLR